ncbi:MAG: DNA-binding response regulator [Ramlibacter sp.]|nr:DNA-binding response regulator [Ramlibacter sp.]
MRTPEERRPTAVIAEDEPLLAEELAELLQALWPQLQVVARVNDGVAALHAVEEHRPDVVFLDIQMPLLNGLEVAQRIGGSCHIVFITSYDAHALQAFEAGAIDYVLKPPTAARLLTTLERVKVRLQRPAPDLRGPIAQITAAAVAPKRHLQWINASRGSAVRLITVEEILYFKSDQKFTLVVTADSESLIRKTIRELSEELDPTMFWQVHRSTIVSLYAIDSVTRDERGNLSLRLKNRPETLAVSEAHTHLFRQM